MPELATDPPIIPPGSGRVITSRPRAQYDDELVGLYSAQNILSVIESSPPQTSFLTDLLFGQEMLQENSLVFVDQLTSNQRLAPFVSVYGKGSSVPRERYRTHYVESPLLAPIRVCSGQDLISRVPGESTSGGMDASARAAWYLGRDLNELDRMVTRTVEKMVADCLFEGTTDIVDWDSDVLLSRIEWGPVIPTVVSLPWNDPNSSPPLDLVAAMRYITGASYTMADIVVFGSEAANLWESHPKVQAAYNQLHYTVGELRPEQRSAGVSSLGNYRGIPLLVDEQQYTDKQGVATPFVPPNCVLVASSSNSGRVIYTGVAQPNQDRTAIDVITARRVPWVFIPDDDVQLKVRLAARPLPIPPAPNTWTYLDVLP